MTEYSTDVANEDMLDSKKKNSLPQHPQVKAQFERGSLY